MLSHKSRQFHTSLRSCVYIWCIMQASTFVPDCLVHSIMIRQHFSPFGQHCQQWGTRFFFDLMNPHPKWDVGLGVHCRDLSLKAHMCKPMCSRHACLYTSRQCTPQTPPAPASVKACDMLTCSCKFANHPCRLLAKAGPSIHLHCLSCTCQTSTHASLSCLFALLLQPRLSLTSK